MADHTHHAGGWMLSYRYMHMSMDGINASDMEASMAGYSVVPTEMTMDMHMLGAMYAPSDKLTLMLMTNYVLKDMDMRSIGGPSSHNHAMQQMGMHMNHRNQNGHMMSHSEHMATESGSHGSSHGGHGNHSHSTEGWGDTVLSALYSIFKGETLNAHVSLGIGLPTAEVEERMHGSYQPYGMQLGNGVWDLRPSITVNGLQDRFAWGAQASGRISLESENDAGFRYGDQLAATLWASLPIQQAFALSARLLYQYTGDLEGQYDQMSHAASTPFGTENYGGENLIGALGGSFTGQEGWIEGHRIAFEFLYPLDQDLNGIQMETEYSFILGWQKSF